MTSQKCTSQQAQIDRARARALEMAERGVRPTLLRQLDQPERTIQTWSVPSRTTDGALYLVDARTDADGTHTLCSCKAAETGAVCWHRSITRAAIFGEVAHRDGRRLLAPVTAETLAGKPERLELADYVIAALAV